MLYLRIKLGLLYQKGWEKNKKRWLNVILKYEDMKKKLVEGRET